MSQYTNNAFRKANPAKPEKSFMDKHGTILGGGVLALGMILVGTQYAGNNGNFSADVTDEETTQEEVVTETTTEENTAETATEETSETTQEEATTEESSAEEVATEEGTEVSETTEEAKPEEKTETTESDAENTEEATEESSEVQTTTNTASDDAESAPVVYASAPETVEPVDSVAVPTALPVEEALPPAQSIKQASSRTKKTVDSNAIFDNATKHNEENSNTRIQVIEESLKFK